MTWQAYCTILTPLIQKFGRDRYSQDVVSKGFNSWKTKDQFKLIEAVNEAIATGLPFVLSEAIANKPPPCRTIYRHENYNQTDGFLERYLALNGCKDVMSLVKKKSAQSKDKESSQAS